PQAMKAPMLGMTIEARLPPKRWTRSCTTPLLTVERRAASSERPGGPATANLAAESCDNPSAPIRRVSRSVGRLSKDPGQPPHVAVAEQRADHDRLDERRFVERDRAHHDVGRVRI